MLALRRGNHRAKDSQVARPGAFRTATSRGLGPQPTWRRDTSTQPRGPGRNPSRAAVLRPLGRQPGRQPGTLKNRVFPDQPPWGRRDSSSARHTGWPAGTDSPESGTCSTVRSERPAPLGRVLGTPSFAVLDAKWHCSESATRCSLGPGSHGWRPSSRRGVCRRSGYGFWERGRREALPLVTSVLVELCRLPSHRPELRVTARRLRALGGCPRCSVGLHRRGDANIGTARPLHDVRPRARPGSLFGLGLLAGWCRAADPSSVLWSGRYHSNDAWAALRFAFGGLLPGHPAAGRAHTPGRSDGLGQGSQAEQTFVAARRPEDPATERHSRRGRASGLSGDGQPSARLQPNSAPPTSTALTIDAQNTPEHATNPVCGERNTTFLAGSRKTLEPRGDLWPCRGSLPGERIVT